MRISSQIRDGPADKTKWDLGRAPVLDVGSVSRLAERGRFVSLVRLLSSQYSSGYPILPALFPNGMLRSGGKPSHISGIGHRSNIVHETSIVSFATQPRQNPSRERWALSPPRRNSRPSRDSGPPCARPRTRSCALTGHHPVTQQTEVQGRVLGGRSNVIRFCRRN
jgi:hypothetical protein